MVLMIVDYTLLSQLRMRECSGCSHGIHDSHGSEVLDEVVANATAFEETRRRRRVRRDSAM